MAKVARAFTIQTRIPVKFWPWALRASVDTINCLPHKSVPGKTPYQAYYDKLYPTEDNRPDLSIRRIPGCKVYIYIESEKRHKGSKLASRAKEGIFLGYKGNHLYEVYCPENRKFSITQNVVFHEDLENIPHLLRTLPPHVRRRGNKPSPKTIDLGWAGWAGRPGPEGLAGREPRSQKNNSQRNNQLEDPDQVEDNSCEDHDENNRSESSVESL